MTDKWFVIDQDGNTSWFVNEDNSSDDGPEYFETEGAAIERAKELAQSAPDKPIYVAKASHEVVVSTSSPTIKPL